MILNYSLWSRMTLNTVFWSNNLSILIQCHEIVLLSIANCQKSQHNPGWQNRKKLLSFSYNFSNLSYMEHLLRDGGDLDSMDRSLIDYNHAAKVLSASSNTSVAAGHAQSGHAPAQTGHAQPVQQPATSASHAHKVSNINGHGSGESSPPLPPAPPTLGWFNSPIQK